MAKSFLSAEYYKSGRGEVPQPAVEAPEIDPELAEPVEEPFIMDGEVLHSGSIRYKVIDRAGNVVWKRVVPPDATEDDLRTVQAERDQVQARLVRPVRPRGMFVK